MLGFFESTSHGKLRSGPITKDGMEKLPTPALRSDAEEHLLTLLQMVNEWLRFAETKNAALLAFSGLSVSAVLGFAIQVESFGSKSAVALLIFGSLLWLAALLITSISFLPKTDVINISSRLDRVPEDSDNLYFYGHLSKYSSDDLLKNLGLPSEPTSTRYRFERNLAEQVITNSRITNDKLKLFGWATNVWILGLLFVTGGTIWTLMSRS